MKKITIEESKLEILFKILGYEYKHMIDDLLNNRINSNIANDRIRLIEKLVIEIIKLFNVPKYIVDNYVERKNIYKKELNKEIKRIEELLKEINNV